MVIDPTDSATLAISASGFKARGTILLPSDMDTAEITARVKSTTADHVEEIVAVPGSKQGEMVMDFSGILGEHYEVENDLFIHPGLIHSHL